MNFIGKLFGKISERKKAPDYIPATAENRQNNTGWKDKLSIQTKRDRQIAALQQGYQETVELIRSIREHLEQQNELQQQVARSLDELTPAVTGLQGLRGATEKQTEVLDGLRRQMRRLWIIPLLCAALLSGSIIWAALRLAPAQDKKPATLKIMPEEPVPLPRAEIRTPPELLENFKTLSEEPLSKEEIRQIFGPPAPQEMNKR